MMMVEVRKMYKISELAQLSGVSTRTLRYYDEIGLLKPASVERSTGYRYYDEESLLRMQEILFYREEGWKSQQLIPVGNVAL